MGEVLRFVVARVETVKVGGRTCNFDEGAADGQFRKLNAPHCVTGQPSAPGPWSLALLAVCVGRCDQGSC